MAGDWIKMEAATPDKPEVLAITAKMGWDDPDLTFGKLFRLWRWFDQHTADGNAEGVTKTVLDRIVGVTGFAEAMESVGWLSVNEAGISLPNFTKHCGMTAKGRAETARRVAKHRDKAAPSEPNKRVVLPRPLRKAILERDGAKCVYCGRQEGEYAPPETAQDALLCLDHVIPVARGGTDDLANLVCACSSCNRFKSDRTPDECGLAWPLNEAGERMGNAARVTSALPREEKRREEEKTMSGKPDVAPGDSPAGLLEYLNAKSGRSYRKVDANLNLIKARLKTATADDIRAVIDAQCEQWRGDPMMDKYLRPETLFGATKFESYIGNLGAAAAGKPKEWEVAL